MNWTNIISEIGIVGIISGLIVWLIKQLGQSYIDKNVKSYELELKNKSELFKVELNQSFEKYKSELEFLSQKANKLHDKRLEKIETFYEMLVDFNLDMETLASWKIVTGMTPEEIEKQNLEDVQKASESGNIFFMYYQKNKLYFSIPTCELIEDIIKSLKSSHADFSFKYMFLNLSPELKMEQVKRATNEIRTEVPKLKSKLEDNFREILGVN